MVTSFTEEQELLRQAVRDFVRKECPREYVRRCDEERQPPREAFRALARQGWLGLGIPEAYGGAGGGTTEGAILLEELGRGFLDLAFWVFRVLAYGGHAILRDGTEEQKRRFLPKVAQGESVFCFALTEPEAGSDAAAISTRAVAQGDGFLLNGQKIFTSGFRVSDRCLLAARTDSSGARHQGITTFLVDCRAPGITTHVIETLGHRPVGTNQVFLENVRVGPEDVLGKVNEGWAGLMAYLEYERLCLSAARTGAAQAVLAVALEHAKVRKQFGRPIGHFQAIAHKLADMETMVDISQVLVYRYAQLLDAGKVRRRDAAILKLYTSETYKAVADMGMQVLGGYGYTMESEMQRHYRDSRLGTIGAGSSEIQRNIIAKDMGL